MKIAFYSPIKPPDHPVPSGDRTMANHLIAALQAAGHLVTLASRLRSYCATPNIGDVEAAADMEIVRLVTGWSSRTAAGRPDVWFTYHPYYKAPDLIGPAVAKELNIAYVTAEASYSSRRQKGEWGDAQARVVEAVRQAAVNFCITPIDREGLARVADQGQLVDLPAFIDVSKFTRTNARQTPAACCNLITVAMMRSGVKFRSYQMLAAALALIRSPDWCLTVIGDGSDRADIVKLFAGFGDDRVRWLGELSGDGVREHLLQSDLYVWPGFGEAYGLAYLEAQACGLPVVAQDTDGVPSVIRHGETGLLTEPGDTSAFAEAIETLIMDTGIRNEMSLAARRFVHEERDLKAASVILNREIKRASLPAASEIALS